MKETVECKHCKKQIQKATYSDKSVEYIEQDGTDLFGYPLYKIHNCKKECEQKQ